MVHELHAALHYIHIFIKHSRIDNVKDVGMRLILSGENSNNIPMRYLHPQIEPMWFIDGLVIEDEQLDVWIVQFADSSKSLSNGARIIIATDGDDLHEFFWVVEVVDFLNGFAGDILFMPG